MRVAGGFWLFGTYTQSMRWFHLLLRWLTLLCALVCSVGAHAAVLRAGEQMRNLDSELLVLDDPEARLDFTQALQRYRTSDFLPIKKSGINLGYRGGTLWLALRLQNVDHVDPQFVLSFEQARLDRIDVQVWDSARLAPGDQALAGPALMLASTGDSLPFGARALRHRFPNLLLQLPPGASRVVLVAVRTTGAMQVPIRLYTLHAFHAHTERGQFWMGLYYGILLGLALYNLVLWFSTRERTYLSYVLYICIFGLTMLCLNGYAFELFWPTRPHWTNLSVKLGVTLSLAAANEFSRLFLEFERNLPRLNKPTRWLTWLLLTLSVAWLWIDDAPWNMALLTVLVLLHAPCNLLCALVCYARGSRPAGFFLLSWTPLILGTALIAAAALNWLPATAFTEYSLQIGSAVEMVLLSFALAYRLNLLRAENLQLADLARSKLEERVQERTSELNRALGELKTANARLSEHGRRDGLTGLYNRGHFDESLRALRAEQDARPALLMIDIDHFKQVNDQFGHPAGDACLRALARVLEQSAAEHSALVARYGGEEFAILTPALSCERVTRIADELLQKVRALRVGATELRFTVSIGTAMLAPDQQGESLVERADAALYQAKRAGRDRVVAIHH